MILDDEKTNVALDEFRKVDELIAVYKQLETEQKELDQMREQLKEEKADLMKQLEQTCKEKCEIQRNMQLQLNDAEVPKFECGELKETLDTMCTLTGYCITELERVEQKFNQRIQRIKLQYNDTNCYVVLEMNIISAKYELIEIYPLPARFEEIKTTLQSTQDVTGLLGSLLKFFEKSDE